MTLKEKASAYRATRHRAQCVGDDIENAYINGAKYILERAKAAYCKEHCPMLVKGEYCWNDCDDNCKGFDEFLKEIYG